jgi:hypothetical protein
LKINDGAEDAVLQAPTGELGEKALHRIEPQTGWRHEVEAPGRCRASQARTLGCLWVV